MTYAYSDFDWEPGDEGDLLVSTPARMGEPGDTYPLRARFTGFAGKTANFEVPEPHEDLSFADEQWCMVEFAGQSIDPGLVHVLRQKGLTELQVRFKVGPERESVLDRVLE